VIQNYRTTGAVAPSSAHLARAMTSRLDRSSAAGRRTLEVGPGTGAVTRHILPTLRRGDGLTIVELNPAFCRRLEAELLAPYRAANAGVAVELHCTPIEQYAGDAPFDNIICSLPFNNFPLALVRRIFRHLFDLLAADGHLVYFEYVGLQAIRAPLVGADGRQTLRRRRAITRGLQRRHHAERQLVLRNIPPAVSVRLRRAC
jgi:phospholipid N-methyltransferase